MKRIILVLSVLISIILTSCSTVQKKIEKNPLASITSKPLSLAKITVTGFRFTKIPVLNSYYTPDTSITIKNLTSKTLKIIWDESSINGNQLYIEDITHSDVKVHSSESYVPSKASQEFTIYDMTKVEFENENTISFGEYREKDFPIKLKLTFEQGNKKEIYTALIKR